MKAKLIFDGKEFEVEITEEEAKKFEQKAKRTGYERVQNVYDNFSAVTIEGNVLSDYFDDAGVGRFADNCYDNANYYTSREVAENNARADKLMRQLRRFAVEHRKNEINYDKDIIWYEIGYNEGLTVEDVDCYRYFGSIAFDSYKAAQLAIDTFRDELLWYFTEYKDSL